MNVAVNIFAVIGFISITIPVLLFLVWRACRVVARAQIRRLERIRKLTPSPTT